MKYRLEIDGLRALAVLPVVFFHADYEMFKGGFIGVDIFFVISGYLITTIIINDLENNNFTLANFYERRARRILPALFFVMLCCVPPALAFMGTAQFNGFTKSLVATSLFISNILFLFESNYFDITAEEKPLLHTWSLAVEEQYYLLFPVLLITLWRFGKECIFWIIFSILIFSLAFSELYWRQDKTINFFLTFSRVWEILAGSIAAFIIKKHGVKSNQLLSSIGLIAILLAIFIYDANVPFPSFWTLLPVSGTLLIILFANTNTLVARLLSNRLFVGVGLISYSLYLWHQPILAFLKVIWIDSNDAYSGIAVLISVLTGYLSWRFVERPFRNPNLFSRRKIFLWSSFGIAFFTTIGVSGYLLIKNNMNTGFLNPVNTPIQFGKYLRDNIELREKSWEFVNRLRNAKLQTHNGLAFDLEDPRKKLLLVGNSHSKDVFNTLFFSDSAQNQFQLGRYETQIRDLSEKHPLWSNPNYSESNIILIVSRYREKCIDNLEYVLQRIKTDKKTAVVVKNIYEFFGSAENYNLIDRLTHKYYKKKLSPHAASLKINSDHFNLFNLYTDQNRSAYLNKVIDKLCNEYDTLILDRMDYICDYENNLYLAVQNDMTKNFYDYGHNTISGAKFFGKRIDKIKWLKYLSSNDSKN